MGKNNRLKQFKAESKAIGKLEDAMEEAIELISSGNTTTLPQSKRLIVKRVRALCDRYLKAEKEARI